jgi:hypothetical protein
VIKRQSPYGGVINPYARATHPTIGKVERMDTDVFRYRTQEGCKDIIAGTASINIPTIRKIRTIKRRVITGMSSRLNDTNKVIGYLVIRKDQA